MPGESAVGRPKRSSQATLQEAAYELFLERGYSAVSVDEIARRAGVSRSTFWAYAASKSDLLWFEVDTALDRLEHRLARRDVGGATELSDAVREVAAQYGPGAMPLPFLEITTMGISEELRASGLTRLLRLVDLLTAALAESPASDLAGASGARTIAWRDAAEVVAAAEAWLTNRPRGSLVDHLTSL